MSWIKTLVVLCLITISMFFSADFLYTKFIFVETDNEKIYRISHNVFHHTLSSSYNGTGLWGGKIYDVCTDINGFKSSCEDSNNESKHFDIAFIGDSFTEAIGMEYNNSFVGMFANDFPYTTVANLGVSSYSPTIYYSKIKWLLEHGYKFDHIYVFVDISDIQDESVYGAGLRKFTVVRRLRTFMKENFILFRTGYYFFQNISFEKVEQADEEVEQADEEVEQAAIYTIDRSAWTYDINAKGYGDIGVSGSVDKAVLQMTALYDLLRSNGIKLSVGVYPWPAQLHEIKHSPDRENMQSQIWRSFCEQRCENFVDLFPRYAELVETYGVDQVYSDYFIPGDVHYNVEGNRLIYEEIIKATR